MTDISSSDRATDEVLVARLADELRAMPDVLGAIWVGSVDRLRFRQCRESGESWLHGYVTGRVLFDKDGTLEALIAEARAIWDVGPIPMPDKDREWERYEMWLQREDIADRIATEKEVAAHLSGALFRRQLRLWYRLGRRWYPPDTYVLRDFDEHSPVVAGIFRRVNATGASADDRLAAIDELFAMIAR